MKDITRTFCLFFLLLFVSTLVAQRPVPLLSGPQPPREHRGVWMATVLNIDYPSRQTAAAASLRAEFDSQLYRLRQLGINTIYLQVRPAADAIYPSALAPWSVWLTGQQGKAPDSQFDPLAHAISAAHAQGVEVHAWVNPYRVSMHTDTSLLATEHLYHQHPEWVYAYNNRMYLDPGMPEVRQHLGTVIDELIQQYDLDGIHFDDYFYPYPAPGMAIPDSLTFRRYGQGRTLADWRRENVNHFIRETHQKIKAAKPWIQFSVSPYGVWRNRTQDPLRGSDTYASVSSYDDLYGDALAWAEAGIVDYLIPQLYWSQQFAPANHRTLLDWWVKHTPRQTPLLIGHAAYKVQQDPDTAWHQPGELREQITLTRRRGQVQGSVFFSARSLLGHHSNVGQELRQAYQKIALLPAKKAPRSAPTIKLKTRRPKNTSAGNRLQWSISKKVPLDKRPHYFAIYRATQKQGPWELIHRTPYGQSCHDFYFLDAFPLPDTRFRYQVIPMDRYHRSMDKRAAAR